MAGHTVTRAQLTEAVYHQVGLSRNESAELVESVIAEIARALERGDVVKISSFGSFAVRQKGHRVGRNPKTGEEVPISPRRVLVFRASHTLKHQINGTQNRFPSASAADAGAAPERSRTVEAASD
ncbi:MAG: integration host factor subunit alpha [Alphaproteobacteria bacterium]